MGASLKNGDLQDIIDHLRSLSDELPEAIVGMREDMPTPLALANDIDLIESWLDAQGIAAEGMDDKTRAAYMIGGIAWSVCIWIAAFELSGQPAIRRVGIRQERYWYRHEDFAHEYVRYPIAIETGEGPAEPRQIIEELFAPLIAATMVTSGLSAGAQWRLVADNVANAYLWAGKGLGKPEEAMARAEAIIAEGRLNNGKTGYVEISAGAATACYLVRGGCCRYYTTSEGQGAYCTSCVLRKRDDQIARYTNYLASLQPAE